MCLCPNLRYKILLSGCVSTSERIRIGVQNTRVGYFTFFKHNLFNFTVRWLVLVESNQKQLRWRYLWRYSAWSVWHLWPNQQWCWLDTWKPNGDGKGWFRANPRNGVELQHQPWSGLCTFFLSFLFCSKLSNIFKTGNAEQHNKWWQQSHLTVSVFELVDLGRCQWGHGSVKVN